jgi:hypothetical protein
LAIAHVYDLLTESDQHRRIDGSETNMGFKHTSSPRVASLASQGLFDPGSLSLDDVRAICATALARVPDHRQSEIVKARPLVEQIDMALAVVRLAELSDDAA